MHDCTDCAYEEFFLASQTVGDPAMLVNYPANTGIEACSPENIAAGQDTGEGAIHAWWHSPGHHKNMLGGHGRVGLGRRDPLGHGGHRWGVGHGRSP